MDAARELKLPPDLTQAVREKAIAGGYPDELAVIRAGLAAIADHEDHLEDWMIDGIRETHAKWKAGTLETVSMEDVRAKFRTERAKRR